MSDREHDRELESKLRRQRDELEEQMREFCRMQEKEEYDLLDSYRYLDKIWNESEDKSQELESLLEEERKILDEYKIKYDECGQTIYAEFNKKMAELDERISKSQSENDSEENADGTL